MKWRNIFIAQSQIAKHTHRKVDGSRRRMSFNLRQDHSFATTKTNINVSRLSRLFSLMNTFNQFCFRKRTISCGYPYTKTLILTFSRHFRFFFLSLTIYLTQLSGNSLLIMWVHFTRGAWDGYPASKSRWFLYNYKHMSDNSMRTTYVRWGLPYIPHFLCLCDSPICSQWTLGQVW